jgi:hypothetical protein
MARPASPFPAPLAKAARRFEEWRRKRTTRCIPEDLWALAAGLGARHGVSRTARALRIQYYDLKKRVEAAATPSSEEPAPSPAFVEILTAAPAAPSECLVEFESPSGAKMRIQAKGWSTADLASLSRLFLEQRA